MILSTDSFDHTAVIPGGIARPIAVRVAGVICAAPFVVVSPSREGGRMP